MIRIDDQKCNACKLCEKSCPFGAIAVVGSRAEVNDSCTLCGACYNVCPQGAVIVERPPVSTEDLSKYRGVLVWAECENRQGRLEPKRVVHELLSQGRRLADKLNQELTAVAIGGERMSALESLCHYGADRVLSCVHPLLDVFSTDGFSHVMSAVIADRKPAIVLYGATPNGRELAPRVAARLRLGLTADCTGLDIDDQQQLVQTRPAFGGNIMASIIAPRTRPQTATVRPNVFPADGYDPARAVRVEPYEVRLNKAAIRTRVVEEVFLDDEGGVNLEEARIVVAAGRGFGGETDLELMRRLAERLRGVMAGSRPLVEEGKIPHTRQVGQSGITVGPDLYLAAGISGAVQHIVGMSASRTIIAVNPDPDAPIFKVADLGIVGDAREILPRLLQELERTPAA